jgi:lysophospholipase L1-like esterase
MYRIQRAVARLLFFTLGLAACASPCPAQENNKETKPLPLVILLGDSIRMNYQAAATTALQKKATVWSPQENCKHTLYTLQNLEKWLADKNPAVVHINVGLHDMFLTTKGGQPRHNLAFYEANLQNIFAQLKHLTNARLIFALTTPVDEERQAVSKGYGRVVRRSADVARYNQAARRIALAAGATVNDLPALVLKSGQADIMGDDGIHLSDKGCALLGKAVANQVLSQLNPKQPGTRSKPIMVGNMAAHEIVKRLGARMEEGMPASELDHYAFQFNREDRNRDGQHTRQEYVETGRYLTPQARAGIFQAADGNSDGVVTRDEYTLNRIITDEAKIVIQRMDDDKDGYVEEPEFIKHATRLLGDAKLAATVYALLDRNRDGEILTSEYLRTWGQWARSGQPSAEKRIAARRAVVAQPKP